MTNGYSETLTATSELVAETRCGKTLLAHEKGKAFLDQREEVEYTEFFRCDREPDHDGPHFGPMVEMSGSWREWE